MTISNLQVFAVGATSTGFARTVTPCSLVDLLLEFGSQRGDRCRNNRDHNRGHTQDWGDQAGTMHRACSWSVAATLVPIQTIAAIVDTILRYDQPAPQAFRHCPMEGWYGRYLCVAGTGMIAIRAFPQEPTAMRNATLLMFTLLAGCSSMSATAPGAETMSPGMWSLTMTIEQDGKAQSLPAVSQCINQHDIDDGTRTLPRPEGKCSLSNLNRSAAGATYDIECMNGAVVSQGRAELRIAADHYDGRVAMTVSENGLAGRPLAMLINAKRVGACTK